MSLWSGCEAAMVEKDGYSLAFCFIYSVMAGDPIVHNNDSGSRCITFRIARNTPLLVTKSGILFVHVI